MKTLAPKLAYESLAKKLNNLSHAIANRAEKMKNGIR